jgi:membrane-associated phospholipid phosphatase
MVPLQQPQTTSSSSVVASFSPASSLPPTYLLPPPQALALRESPSPARKPFIPVHFPAALERLLAPLDDPPIARAQRLWAYLPIRAAVLLVTTATAIETALPAPPLLYALGYDRAAGLATSSLLLLALVSQTPKKFIFRPRPWMAGRAVAHRRDNTSSFPSRAVTCSVVFTWLAFTCYSMERVAPPVGPVVVWASVFIVAAISAFSRVNVGAHYPSDTVCGLVLGMAILSYAARVEALWTVLGTPALPLHPQNSLVALSRHYASQLPPTQLPDATVVISSTRSLVENTPYARLITCIALSYVLTVVSIAGFWVKCSYVYGLLLSAATFRCVYLSPSSTNVAFTTILPVMRASWGSHARASAVFLAWLAFGMVTRGKKGPYRIIAFTLIYFGVLINMIMWRLSAPL